jgi:hypothetical protein
VIDVLSKFIPKFGANFVLGFAFVTIRRSEAYEGTVSMSRMSTCGMSGAWRMLQHIQLLYAADTVMKRRRKILLTRFTFK